VADYDHHPALVVMDGFEMGVLVSELRGSQVIPWSRPAHAALMLGICGLAFRSNTA